MNANPTQGGSYSRDPVTGELVTLHQTAQPEAALTPDASLLPQDGASQPTTSAPAAPADSAQPEA